MRYIACSADQLLWRRRRCRKGWEQRVAGPSHPAPCAAFPPLPLPAATPPLRSPRLQHTPSPCRRPVTPRPQVLTSGMWPQTSSAPTCVLPRELEQCTSEFVAYYLHANSGGCGACVWWWWWCVCVGGVDVAGCVCWVGCGRLCVCYVGRAGWVPAAPGTALCRTVGQQAARPAADQPA